MRVLYFHQHFTTPQGASGIRSYEMARRLLARGHQVTMVCGSSGVGKTGLDIPFKKGVRRGFVDGIEVIELDLPYSNSDSFVKRGFTFLKFAFRSILLVFKENYDLVFATTTPLTAGVPGILARWLRGKPFVFEVRDLWPELPKAMGVIKNPLVLWAMSVLEWSSYRSAHRVIGLSPGIVDGIVKCGVTRSKIALIPNGCDFNIFAHGVEPWKPHQVGDGDLLAVFAGTHGLANGLDAILDAAAELKRRKRADIKMVLIGGGKIKPHLMARAASENLDNIIFLEPVNKARLAGLMARTDIGLQVLANVPAFYYGTSPNKFFDYISASLPVLCNYPGWMAEMIKSNGCGFAVEPESPSSFADALEKAADDRELLRAMGGRGRLLAEREFDRTKLSNKFVDWLEDAAR